MPEFPSIEWFKAVNERVNGERERFRALGYVDADVGIRIDGNGQGVRNYLLRFRDYGVVAVAETKDLEEADFTIEGSLSAWNEMVNNITENGEADTAHSLNRLTMAGTPLKVTAADQLKTDIFYRFNQSFQAYFNEAAAVPTEFAASRRERE
jgi:hypothetical protein